MGSTLAGITLAGRVDWQRTAGVSPWTTTLELPKEVALKIYAQAGKPLTLIQDGNTFKTVWVIALIAGGEDETRGLFLADSRFWWATTRIRRAYNVRLRTGERVLVANERIENQPLPDDIKFAEWSLNNGKAWTIEDALNDVLSEIPEQSSVPPIQRQITFEDFDQEEMLPTSEMIRALLQFVQYQITLDDDNTARVYDPRDIAAGIAELQTYPPAFRSVGTGTIQFSDYRYMRPSGVDVFVTPEIETRFDFVEEESRSVARGQEEPTLEMVLPTPDEKMTINGNQVGLGSWVSFDGFFASPEVKAQSLGPRAPGPLSHRVMRAGFHKKRYFWAPYELDSGGAPNPDGAYRVDESKRNWRQSFRVAKGFADRIRSIRAKRVGIVNSETKTMAPSRVYTSFISVPSSRALFLNTKSGQRLKYGWQEDNYVSRDKSLRGKRESAAQVRVIDPDAKIIRIHLTSGRNRDIGRIIPGNLTNLPDNADAGGAQRTLLIEETVLKAGWGLAVLMTCIPAGPNSNKALHKESITPAEAETALGQTIGPSLGPRMQIKIAEGPTTTARFHWDDARREEILQSYWGGGPPPADLLANPKQVRDIAIAAAARVYSTMLDAPEGRASFPQQVGAKIHGGITSIADTRGPNGILATSISMQRPVTPRDIYSLLPPETRKIIRGEVQP